MSFSRSAGERVFHALRPQRAAREAQPAAVAAAGEMAPAWDGPAPSSAAEL